MGLGDRHKRAHRYQGESAGNNACSARIERTRLVAGPERHQRQSEHGAHDRTANMGGIVDPQAFVGSRKKRQHCRNQDRHRARLHQVALGAGAKVKAEHDCRSKKADNAA